MKPSAAEVGASGVESEVVKSMAPAAGVVAAAAVAAAVVVLAETAAMGVGPLLAKARGYS